MTGMKLGMMACCAIMFIPIVGYFAAGGFFAVGGGVLSAALPLMICLAAHGLMFVLMGKSCQSDEKETETKPSSIPVVLQKTKKPLQGVVSRQDLNAG